jgi:hypothetical protein
LPRGRPGGRDAPDGEDLLVEGSPGEELLLDRRLVDLSVNPCDSEKKKKLTHQLAVEKKINALD